MIYEKHSQSYTRLYQIWADMKQRCLNPKAVNYHRYGGRNIKIYSKWENSFLSFRKWAISRDYKDDLTLDRINNEGNYEPNNCHFVSMAIQGRNRCTNMRYKGELAVDAVKRLGGNPSLIAGRIKRGWSIKKAFTTPLLRKYIK